MVRAIDIVRIALESFGPPIYVRKEIVHNRFVVEELSAKGAIFVDEVDEVPDWQMVIYSAHGVAPGGARGQRTAGFEGDRRHLSAGDQGSRGGSAFAKEGYSLILIGHRDHDEVIGTLGEAPGVTQVVGSVADVEQLQRARSGARGLSDADDAQPGRDGRHYRGVAPDISADPRARRRRTSVTPPRTARRR